MKVISEKNLIVGTGPTALAAAMAFRSLDVPFEVLDVGYDLNPNRERMVNALAASDPEDWSKPRIEALFPPPATSVKGVEKRFAFGSDFAYRRPAQLSLTTEDCLVDVSHGLGGFGNVWGAAMLPYTAHDVANWPIPLADLERSYERVARFVPRSAEADALQSIFPLYGDDLPALERSDQTRRLLKWLEGRRERLRDQGVHFGRARVAVDSSGMTTTTCRYCGRCLDGCVYGSIFSSRRHWILLEREGIVIHRGRYALEFQDVPEGVRLTTVDVESGATEHWLADRLFLAAGAIGTTRLLARSLGLVNRPIRLLDSQYFFFPMLAYRGVQDMSDRFALAEVFIELLTTRISDHFVHFQVYGLNDLFRRTLRAMVPAAVSQWGLSGSVERRFYLFQGFLHSADSGQLELTITDAAPTHDVAHVRGVTNPAAGRVARRAQRLLRRQLLRFGLVPPRSLTTVPPGRSFHAGGSFPMGSRDPVYTSDLLGRPAGLERVHVLDATTFPSIPATTITYTAMANADRLVHETHREGLLA